jgi:hypothetical protein
MHIQKTKRGLPPGNSDRPKLKRSRNDIAATASPTTPVYLTTEDISILKKYQPTAMSKAKVKSPKSALHCGFCDNKFTSREALSRHNEIKSTNTGKQIILPRAFKKNSSHIIVCSEMECCFSTKILNEIYKHDRAFHNNKNFSGAVSGHQISVLNIISNMDEPSDNTCSKCLKNFTTAKTLSNHKSLCGGKQIFSCTICREGFLTHIVDSSFKTTGVFLGKSRKQNSTLFLIISWLPD